MGEREAKQAELPGDEWAAETWAKGPPFVVAFAVFEDLLDAFERLHKPRDCHEPLCVHCDAYREAMEAKHDAEEDHP